MDTHRYFGIKDFTRIAKERHAEGNPFKPGGCKGNLSVIYYDESAKEGFGGNLMAFGTLIRASCLPEYVYTLNHLLDMGAEVKHLSANFGLGGLVSCSYALDVNTYEIQKAKLKNQNEENQAEADPEGVGEETCDDSEVSQPPPSSETLSASEEGDECGELPDWDYAESLIDFSGPGSNKTALKNYAATFDVKLNKAKKFENMIVDFKHALEGHPDD